MTEKTCVRETCSELPRTCPECGASMTRGIRPMTINYKGLSTTFDMPGWYCGECGEGIVTGKDMDVSDQELNRLKAQVEHLVLPSEVRRIRKKLGLNQQKAGALLGGGPNAFHKYESVRLLLLRSVIH